MIRIKSGGVTAIGGIMSASNIATTVNFASLGLVALALGLLVRRYSHRALAIGLIGLFALTTSLTWISYAGPAIPEIPPANGEREQIRVLEKRVAALKIENDQIRADHDTMQARLGDAQRDADQAKAEIKRLSAELQAERDTAKRNQEAASARIVELETKIAKLEELLKAIPQQPPPSPQPKGTPLDIPSPFYSSERLEQRTLVAGLTGNWYVIRLKLGGKPLSFDDGQYRLPGAVQELTESALQLNKKLLVPIRQVAKSTRLFLRGTADDRPLLGTPKELEVRELKILPRLPDGTYEAAPRRVSLPAHFHNKDLPNLRADWLRQHVRPLLQSVASSDIEILDNRPSPNNERTAELIVFVEWSE
jgi:hypothetical protein